MAANSVCNAGVGYVRFYIHTVVVKRGQNNVERAEEEERREGVTLPVFDTILPGRYGSASWDRNCELMHAWYYCMRVYTAQKQVGGFIANSSIN